MDLAGKIAFITGGGGGIGAGIGAALVEKGMRVVLSDIDLDRARKEAEALGQAARAIAIDVTDEQSWAKAKAEVEAELGPVDVLCNNAGIATAPLLLDETPPSLFARIMAINVTGVFNGIRAFAPDMKARGQGHIVNTSSLNGLLAHGTFGAYSASKFAVTGMTDALRQELAPFGVGVSTLYPGLTRSYMSMSEDSAALMADVPEEVRQAQMMDPLWLGRAVARAIENNSEHIITHPSARPEVERRQQVLLSAFGEPAQPEYAG
ncbi:SDR family oxidoreductase [Novosphingobium sp. M1R2S20]|uniref:SDR family oxidoreductase n=1 Tax=Novosphingobium rhizovicinum TaxID=3228928 RepID=A0ABV3RF19_9SPHN